MDAAECFQKFNQRFAQRKRVAEEPQGDAAVRAEGRNVFDSFEVGRGHEERSKRPITSGNTSGAFKENLQAAPQKSRKVASASCSKREAPPAIADALGAHAAGGQRSSRQQALGSALSLMKGLRGSKQPTGRPPPAQAARLQVAPPQRQAVARSGATSYDAGEAEGQPSSFMQRASSARHPPAAVANAVSHGSKGRAPPADVRSQQMQGTGRTQAAALAEQASQASSRSRSSGDVSPGPPAAAPSKQPWHVGIQLEQYFEAAKHHLRTLAEASNGLRKGALGSQHMVQVLASKIEGNVEGLLDVARQSAPEAQPGGGGAGQEEEQDSAAHCGRPQSLSLPVQPMRLGQPSAPAVSLSGASHQQASWRAGAGSKLSSFGPLLQARPQLHPSTSLGRSSFRSGPGTLGEPAVLAPGSDVFQRGRPSSGMLDDFLEDDVMSGTSDMARPPAQKRHKLDLGDGMWASWDQDFTAAGRGKEPPPAYLRSGPILPGPHSAVELSEEEGGFAGLSFGPFLGMAGSRRPPAVSAVEGDSTMLQAAGNAACSRLGTGWEQPQDLDWLAGNAGASAPSPAFGGAASSQGVQGADRQCHSFWEELRGGEVLPAQPVQQDWQLGSTGAPDPNGTHWSLHVGTQQVSRASHGFWSSGNDSLSWLRKA